MIVKRVSPIISTTEQSLKRMINFHMAVLFVSLASVVLYLFIDLELTLLAFIKLILALLLAGIITVLKARLQDKTDQLVRYSTYIPAINISLLISLVLPVNTPIFIIVLAIILAHLLKALMITFFHEQVTNPVVMSLVIVMTVFQRFLDLEASFLALYDGSELVITVFQVMFGLFDGLLLGTSALVILFIAYIYLIIAKSIHFEMSLAFLVHLFLFTLMLSTFTNRSLSTLVPSLWLGYTTFAVVFLLAEPTATPETREGMMLYPFIVALLLVIFNVLFGIIPAILYALFFGELIAWALETVKRRSTITSIRATRAFIVLVWAIVLALNIW